MAPPEGRAKPVAGGPVRTLAVRARGVEEMLMRYERGAPPGRNVTHEEVGRTGVFLPNPTSNGITGEVLHVDCGYKMMGSPGRLLDKLRS